MALFTYLDAINHMLLSSGENIVSDLDLESNVDTSVAEFILNTTIKSYVMRGLVNNRFVVTLPLETTQRVIDGTTTTNYIVLPTKTFYAQVVEPLFDSTTGEVIQTTVKSTDSGPVLWNITKQTAVFEKELKVEVIVLLGDETNKWGWDDIDSPLQRGIMESAAREYQMVSQGDLDVDKRMAVKEQFYTAKGRASDIFKKNRNLFASGDYGRIAAISRRGILTNDPYFTRTRY